MGVVMLAWWELSKYKPSTKMKGSVFLIPALFRLSLKVQVKGCIIYFMNPDTINYLGT